MKQQPWPLPLLIVAGALMFASVGAAHEDDAIPDEDKAIAIPADEFGRGTPSRTADGFLDAAEKGDYERASRYLDLRNLRGEADQLTGEELARRFQVIIQRAQWIDVDELVDHPDGRRNDGLPTYRDSIGLILDNKREVRLLMQRVPREDGVFIWKVSNATVSLIPGLYAVYGYPAIIERLSLALPNIVFLGYELFKWVVVITVGALVWAVVFAFTLLLRRGESTPARKRLIRFLSIPFTIWLIILSVNWTASALGTGRLAEQWAAVTPLPILLTVWMLYTAANLVRDYNRSRLLEMERPGAALMMRPASNAFKLLVAVVAVLAYMSQLGIDITTVLAGLGVGGVAVALALQKPMEDVFGAVTLYSQQPVRLGDFCKIGNETGNIEEIGLRTTRIRTLADTVISIPNSRMAVEPIDNISARQKILFRPLLRLRYDTPTEQMETVLEGIRTMLVEHEHVSPASLRVRFKEISTDALLIEVFAYVTTTDWATYLEIAEDLNKRIIDIIAAAGTSLAPPVWEMRS